ncbi:hypothetical protein KBW71_02715 [Hydrogenophaga aromaticivorans]|uniref:hypothetical protein n=1 Tax=Hydrogenophaga aromaticivorans TaxID=2610898 RepID=UPI001B3783CC|nr:hypothetical protein [Hydrogenophaga aromaticivorans]MBQ0917345.1 hypothetical protein [Hydrogenophaga aromaticivorans]
MEASPTHFMTGMDHRTVRTNGMRFNLHAFTLPGTIRAGLEDTGRRLPPVWGATSAISRAGCAARC